MGPPCRAESREQLQGQGPLLSFLQSAQHSIVAKHIRWNLFITHRWIENKGCSFFMRKSKPKGEWHWVMRMYSLYIYINIYRYIWLYECVKRYTTWHAFIYIYICRSVYIHIEKNQVYDMDKNNWTPNDLCDSLFRASVRCFWYWECHSCMVLHCLREGQNSHPSTNKWLKISSEISILYIYICISFSLDRKGRRKNL